MSWRWPPGRVGGVDQLGPYFTRCSRSGRASAPSAPTFNDPLIYSGRHPLLQGSAASGQRTWTRCSRSSSRLESLSRDERSSRSSGSSRARPSDGAGPLVAVTPWAGVGAVDPAHPALRAPTSSQPRPLPGPGSARCSCRGASTRRPVRGPWYDWLCSAGGLGVGAYVLVLYPTLAYSLAVLTWDKLVFACSCHRAHPGRRRDVFCRLGADVDRRRVRALRQVQLTSCPHPLYAKGSGWGRILVYLYLHTNCILGVPLAVTATIVVAYIFFGQALSAVGGDKFLSRPRARGDGALSRWCRQDGDRLQPLRDGPGSAVANVVVDGAVTIPMMKRSGYPPHMAAAIEAVASNGGQIMPPVMGACRLPDRRVPVGARRHRGAAAAIPPARLSRAVRPGRPGAPRWTGRASAARRAGWARRCAGAGCSWSRRLVLVYTLMIAGGSQAGGNVVVATFLVGALDKETRPDLRHGQCPRAGRRCST